jgi:hypothetical protein
VLQLFRKQCTLGFSLRGLYAEPVLKTCTNAHAISTQLMNISALARSRHVQQAVLRYAHALCMTIAVLLCR